MLFVCQYLQICYTHENDTKLFLLLLYVHFKSSFFVKSVDRTTTIKSFGGNDYFLVEVIAFILKHLKDLLLAHLSDGVRQMKSTHFDWVITVPAIWKARAKRMMREAAYMVFPFK